MQPSPLGFSLRAEADNRDGRGTEAAFGAQDYNLAATLTSGQAFRWQLIDGGWEGVIGSRWVRLRQENNQIRAQTGAPVRDWQWLRHYLQLEVNLAEVLEQFPKDNAIGAAVESCPGLRLLRQEPWECLASFICSSNKQIVQITQIIGLLCQRLGEPVAVPPGHAPLFTFPSSERLAEAPEALLRQCKMGFRAPNLLASAKKIAAGEVDLGRCATLSLEEARAQLLKLPGVGRKIADCVLLFAYGFEEAFPVDVWILKALREIYFTKRRPKPARLRHFTESYFGPRAGYVQQYLFHHRRTGQST